MRRQIQMRTLLPGILVIILLLAESNSLSGQGVAPPPRARPVSAWATAGLGAGTGGFGGVAGFDVLHRQNLLSVRSAFVAELFGDGYWDVGVLYGRASRMSRGMVAASAGLGYMDGERCSGVFSQCIALSPRISVPLALRGAWNVLPFLGLELYGFANLNGRKSFGGLVLALELGRLR